MFFDVYLFYGDPVDALSAGAKSGQLMMRQTGSDHGLTASLLDRNGAEILPPLRHVRMVAMDGKAMVIEGLVTTAHRETLKSRTSTSTVRWVIKQVGAPAVLDTQKLKQRTARRLGMRAATGFDPADDDRVD